MNLSIISKEIKSGALSEIVGSLHETVENVRSGDIRHQQAQVEISGAKHMIQSIALDWLYNKQAKQVNSIVEKIS